MKLKPGAQSLELDHFLGVDASYENIGLVPAHGEHNRRDILRLLALSHNDLRKSLAQGTVMIDLGEAEILKRQVTQLGHSFFDGNAPLAQAFEQFYQMLRVHDQLWPECSDKTHGAF